MLRDEHLKDEAVSRGSVEEVPWASPCNLTYGGYVTFADRYIFKDIRGNYTRLKGAQNVTPPSLVAKLSLLSSPELLELLMTCTCVVRKIDAPPGRISLSLSVSLGIRLLARGCIRIFFGSLCWL